MGDAYITRRGGGAPLNFKVVGGTKPSNPKENTIWVNTDTAITGWHFGAEEPQFNYLPYPYHSGEKLVTNGITFTVNADKSITVNGTAQGGRADFTLYNGQIKAGKYKLSCSLGLNGPDGITVWSYDDSAGLGYLSGGGDVNFEVTKECYGNVTLIVNEGSSYDNITIQPKLVGYEEGTVWIQTGTTSTMAMNVLKKNSIQVCPLNAKQYVGGAWALKDAETYQGGKWNDWAYWIIGNGADGLGITGGFTSNYENQWSFADDGSLTFYKDIDNMYSSFNVPSKRTFDVTNYNSMTIKVSSFSRNASYIGVNAPSNLGKDSTCRVKISAAGTYTLDISAISGEVHLQADLDYNGVTMVVSELYFS